MNKRFKLKLKDSWGQIYYAPQGKDLTKSGSASTDLGIKKPKMVRIYWPDKTITVNKVVSEPYTSRVYDMGHRYDTLTEKWFVEVSVYGQEILVPIEELLIEIIE